MALLTTPCVRAGSFWGVDTEKDGGSGGGGHDER